jgi:hypothetical protein
MNKTSIEGKQQTQDYYERGEVVYRTAASAAYNISIDLRTSYEPIVIPLLHQTRSAIVKSTT